MPVKAASRGSFQRRPVEAACQGGLQERPSGYSFHLPIVACYSLLLDIYRKIWYYVSQAEYWYNGTL